MSSVLGTEAGFVERRIADRRRAQPRESGASWRSGSELLGYALWASDGVVGEVTDLVFEAESLCVTEIVAEERRFFVSKRFCVPLSVVKRVDAVQRRVDLRLTRAQIRQLTSPSESRAARN
jgi:hypothetical protein